jgi:hypothetical protein
MTREPNVRRVGNDSKVVLVSRLVTAFLVAVPINFAWEIAQSVLYAPMGGAWRSTWLCFRASIGDGIIVAGLFAAGTLLFGRGFWTRRPGIVAHSYLILTGILVAIAIEWFATNHERWTYRPTMPLVPGTGIGLVPVLQMAVLPILTMRLATVLNGAQEEA